jgi:hypothetical protein
MSVLGPTSSPGDIAVNREHAESDPVSHPPYQVRLPGFLRDEEIGFGDVIRRVTSTLGVRPCGNCERRAAALNRWLLFTRRAR